MKKWQNELLSQLHESAKPCALCGKLHWITDMIPDEWYPRYICHNCYAKLCKTKAKGKSKGRSKQKGLKRAK